MFKIESITKNQFGKWMICYTENNNYKVDNFKTYDQVRQFIQNNAIIGSYDLEYEQWQQLQSDAKSLSA